MRWGSPDQEFRADSLVLATAPSRLHMYMQHTVHLHQVALVRPEEKTNLSMSKASALT